MFFAGWAAASCSIWLTLQLWTVALYLPSTLLHFLVVLHFHVLPSQAPPADTALCSDAKMIYCVNFINLLRCHKNDNAAQKARKKLNKINLICSCMHSLTWAGVCVCMCVPYVCVLNKFLWATYGCVWHTLQMVFMARRQRTHYTISPTLSRNWNFKILAHFTRSPILRPFSNAKNTCSWRFG